MSNPLRICIVKTLEWVNCFEFSSVHYLCNYVESKFDGDERGAWLIRIGSQWRIFVLYIRFNVGVFVRKCWTEKNILQCFNYLK